MTEDAETGRAGADPNLWALDMGPMHPGGPDWPLLAHLIVSRHDDHLRGEVRTSACGREFTVGTHPRGWWSTRAGNFPMQDHAIHCGQDQVNSQRPAEAQTLGR